MDNREDESDNVYHEAAPNTNMYCKKSEQVPLSIGHEDSQVLKEDKKFGEEHHRAIKYYREVCPLECPPRQPAMANTGADADADESPTTALLRVAAAEMAGDEESDPTPTPRVSQRQRQPQLPPYKGKTPRRSKEARLPKHRKDLGGGALTLPLDDLRRRNPSDQYGLESHEAIRPNGNERGGGRERFWEWSQQRNTLYKRRDDAEARVAARKQRKQDEWNAEIAEHGEEEARARRDLEREAAKAADDLMTSEIAEMDLEDQLANPMLTINAFLSLIPTQRWKNIPYSSKEKSRRLSDLTNKVILSRIIIILPRPSKNPAKNI